VKNPWVYIFLRLAAFGAPLTILLILRFDPIYSVAVATAIGLTISIVWLSRSREELSKTLYDKFNSETKADKDSEN
jgi:hypothetical protein